MIQKVQWLTDEQSVSFRNTHPIIQLNALYEYDLDIDVLVRIYLYPEQKEIKGIRKRIILHLAEKACLAEHGMTIREYIEKEYEKFDAECSLYAQGEAFDNPDEEEACDSDDKPPVIEQARLLPEGWKWVMYNDGSGYLESSDGKEYFSYDRLTQEYREMGKRWRFMENYPAPTPFHEFKEFAERTIAEKFL